MNLFLYEFFMQLDSLAPIISTLKKNNLKVGFASIYPIHDYRKHKLLKLLISEEILFINRIPTNLKNYLVLLFFKIVLYLPKNLLLRFEGFWFKFYNNFNLLSKKEFINFCISNNVVTINIPYDLSEIRKNFINECNQSIKAKIIHIEVGVRVFDTPGNNKLLPNFFDFFIRSNDHDPINEKKEKIKYLGALRYSDSWIKSLDDLYHVKEAEKKKLRIALFLNERMLIEGNEILSNLMSLNEIDFKIATKPKSVLPLKCTDFYLNHKSATSLINWADLIVSHSSSILIEAILKRKKILYCSFANYHEKYNIKKSRIEEIDSIIKINNFDELNEQIEISKKQNNVVNYTQEEYKKIYKLRGFVKDTDVLKNFVYFYKNLN